MMIKEGSGTNLKKLKTEEKIMKKNPVEHLVKVTWEDELKHFFLLTKQWILAGVPDKMFNNDVIWFLGT